MMKKNNMIKQKITIPKGWENVKLGDIADVKNGKSNTQDAISDGKYLFFDRSALIKRSSKFLFDAEAIILPGEGAEFLPRYYKGKFDLHQRAYSIISNNQKADTRYLFYFLFAKRNEFVKKSVGSTVKSLRLPMIQSFSVVLPPLSEQTKIAEILSKVDEDIEKTEGVIRNIEKLKRGLMRELLSGRVRVSLSFRTKRSGERNPLNAANSKRGDDSCLRDSSLSVGMTKKTKLGEIPEDWQVVKVKNSGIRLIDGDRGVNYPKNKDFYSDEYCLFLNNKNVKNDRFIFDECKFITKEKDEELRKGKLEREDVILTTRGTVGSVAYYSSIIPYENIRINSGMLIFRHGKNYNPLFLYKLLSSPFMKQKYKDMSSGSAQPQLPVGSLEQIEIPLLSIEEQKQIAEILLKVDDKIEINKQIKNKLTQLKKGLMQDLLSGIVRV